MKRLLKFRIKTLLIIVAVASLFLAIWQSSAKKNTLIKQRQTARRMLREVTDRRPAWEWGNLREPPFNKTKLYQTVNYLHGLGKTGALDAVQSVFAILEVQLEVALVPQ